GLRRNLGLHDLRALIEVRRWLRRTRPRVLHTHTAKAGAIGRLAVILSPHHRPDVVVHTFHGHVFQGEFSPRAAAVFARIERLLRQRRGRAHVGQRGHPGLPHRGAGGWTSGGLHAGRGGRDGRGRRGDRTHRGKGCRAARGGGPCSPAR